MESRRGPLRKETMKKLVTLSIPGKRTESTMPSKKSERSVAEMNAMSQFERLCRNSDCGISKLTERVKRNHPFVNLSF